MLSIYNLADMYYSQGENDKAFGLAIRAKKGYESVFGVDHQESKDARELVAAIEVGVVGDLL